MKMLNTPEPLSQSSKYFPFQTSVTLALDCHQLWGFEGLPASWSWTCSRYSKECCYIGWASKISFKLTLTLIDKRSGRCPCCRLGKIPIGNIFEMSSKGFLTTRNHTTLATLHKFINPAIKLQHFKKNISALSLTASYHIFNCKSEPTFVEPPFLLPPIKS